MPCTEAYREHIMYTFNGFCKTVIRYVELNMTAGESPLSMKADFLLSLCELVVGGKEGLHPIEKTVVDRCVRLVYREQALGLACVGAPPHMH